MALLKIIDCDDSDPDPGTAGDVVDSVEEQLLARIEAIAREVRDGEDLDAVIQGICTAVSQSSPWPMCGVELYDFENRVFTWLNAGFPPSAAEIFAEWPLEGDPSISAARRNRIVTIPDVLKADEYPHTRREAMRAGYRSAVYVPMRLAGHCAVLTLCRPDVHEFTPAELSMAGVLASLATVTLESATKKRLNAMAKPLGDDLLEQPQQPHDRAPQDSAQDRLLHLQIGGATLSEFCEGFADLLHTPVLLLDRFSQSLSSAQLTPQQSAELAAWISHNKAARVEGQAALHLAEGSRRVMVNHVYDGPQRLGSLVAVLPPNSDSPSTALSQKLELARVHLTLALLRQRAAIATEVRMRQDFGEALASMNTTGLALSQLAAVLGIDMDAPQRVMRVHPAGLRCPLTSHDGFQVAESLSRRLRQIGVDAVVSPVGGVDFVLVLREQQGRRSETTPAQAVRAGLRDVLSTFGPVQIGIGIGHAGVGVEALDRSHREANRALEVARQMDGDESERHIAEVGSYAVLSAASASVAADHELFVRRYLDPLLEYDRVHNAGFIETLQGYFENVGSVQRTAERLFLHLSTVRYRLKRIEELAQVDLRDEEDRLCMQLALRLLRLPSSQHLTQ